MNLPRVPGNYSSAHKHSACLQRLCDVTSWEEGRERERERERGGAKGDRVRYRHSRREESQWERDGECERTREPHSALLEASCFPRVVTPPTRCLPSHCSGLEGLMGKLCFCTDWSERGRLSGWMDGRVCKDYGFIAWCWDTLTLWHGCVCTCTLHPWTLSSEWWKLFNALYCQSFTVLCVCEVFRLAVFVAQGLCPGQSVWWGWKVGLGGVTTDVSAGRDPAVPFIPR